MEAISPQQINCESACFSASSDSASKPLSVRLGASVCGLGQGEQRARGAHGVSMRCARAAHGLWCYLINALLVVE